MNLVNDVKLERLEGGRIILTRILEKVYTNGYIQKWLRIVPNAPGIGMSGVEFWINAATLLVSHSEILIVHPERTGHRCRSPLFRKG